MTSSLVEGVVLFVHRLISPMHQRLHQSGAPVESTDEFNNAAVCSTDSEGAFAVLLLMEPASDITLHSDKWQLTITLVSHHSAVQIAVIIVIRRTGFALPVSSNLLSKINSVSWSTAQAVWLAK